MTATPPRPPRSALPLAVPCALNDAARRAALRARAGEVLAAGEAAPSPCVSVCQMDGASGLCAGCLRSLQEIAAWSSLDDAGRRGVWSRIAQRAQA